MLWLVVSFLAKELLAFSHFADGIDLVYLPSGIRLLLLMIFGIWAAIGISIANAIAFLREFGAGSPIEIIVNSLVVGFSPFAALVAARNWLKIDSNLTTLKPLHLPVLALAASIASPFCLNVAFVVFGRKPIGEFLQNVSAMALGDFCGILLVIALVFLAIKFVRFVLRPSSANI